MRKIIQVSLPAAMSIMLTILLGGCGSSNKEGAAAASNVPRVSETTCRVCHASSIDPFSFLPIVSNFLASPHNINDDLHGCQGCHGGGAQHNGVGPIPFTNPAAAGICGSNSCHPTLAPAAAPATASAALVTAFTANCAHCHNFHAGRVTPDPNNCLGCHDVAAPQHGPNLVGDNNGVRAVVREFSKWSHHVTGVNLQNAHCAACHLEGRAQGGAIVVDPTYHMADNKIHLRDTTTNTDVDFAWNPAAPNHSGMDQFCMSCHDANGAVSPASTAIRALMTPAAGRTASALNPFGDTISNRYDKMLRPAVVDVSGLFDTTNNSHHAVKGPRYSGRTRFAGPRQIASPGTFAANSSATLFGPRMTIYDAVTQDGREAFNALYVPLSNAGGETSPRTGAAELGDDSTLHCGDCHTVGQWKPGTAKSFNPTLPSSEVAGFVSPAIGAHGSNNEYLLRNSRGTDERHTQDASVKETNGNITLKNPNAPFLVCFNCHAYSRYGSNFNATGITGPHAGEYDAGGRCNGTGNILPFNGYTTGTATDGTQFLSRFEGPRATYSSTPAFAPGFPLNFANAPGGVQAATYTGEQDPDFGNVFGIQCLNCHNSGAGNAYGGIHGSKKNQTLAGYTNNPSVTGGSYIDGMGNTAKIVRFLPGLGNAMYVPGTLGGVTGGSTATFLRYSGNLGTSNAASTVFTVLPVRDNRPAVNAKIGSYNFTTGGVANDTNWEQKHWKQSGPGSGGAVATQQQAAGAGCYTLGPVGAPNTVEIQAGKLDQNGNVIPQRTMVTENLRGPSQGSVGSENDANPLLFDNWGGCDDHSSPVGGGRYGFVKRILRPVTY